MHTLTAHTKMPINLTTTAGSGLMETSSSTTTPWSPNHLSGKPPLTAMERAKTHLPATGSTPQPQWVITRCTGLIVTKSTSQVTTMSMKEKEKPALASLCGKNKLFTFPQMNNPLGQLKDLILLVLNTMDTMETLPGL